MQYCVHSKILQNVQKYQLIQIFFGIAEGPMGLWAFLWPIHSAFSIYCITTAGEKKLVTSNK